MEINCAHKTLSLSEAFSCGWWTCLGGGDVKDWILGFVFWPGNLLGWGGGGGATPVGFRFIRVFSWGGLSGSVEGGSYANRPQIYLWFFHLPSEQLLGGERGGGVESWRREQSQQSLHVSWVFSSASWTCCCQCLSGVFYVWVFLFLGGVGWGWRKRGVEQPCPQTVGLSEAFYLASELVAVLSLWLDSQLVLWPVSLVGVVSGVADVACTGLATSQTGSSRASAPLALLCSAP